MDINGTDSRNNVSLANALGSHNKAVSETAAAAFASLLVQGNSQMNATMQLGGERLMSNSDADNIEGDANLDNYSRRDDIAARDDRNDSGNRGDDNRPERHDDRAERPESRNDNPHDDRRDDQRASGDDQARPRDDNRGDDRSQNQNRADDGSDDRPQQAKSQQDDSGDQKQANPNADKGGEPSALQQAANQGAGNVVAAAASQVGQAAAAMASGQINFNNTPGQQNTVKNPGDMAAQMVEGKVAGGENANEQSGQALAQNRGKGQAQAQAKGPIQAAVQQSTDQSGEAKSAMSQQGADLAQRVNNDKPMAVKVNVKTDGAMAETRTNLSQSMVAELGEEGVVRKPGQKQSADVAAKAAANQARQATAQAEQQVNAQATTQTAAQNTQSQAAQAGATQAKGAAQVSAAQAATNTQTMSQGGETANAGPANNAQQTQQSEQAKAAQATKHTQTFKPTTVVDQVSVQITKALHMGADKISIQLRPDSLGKIEVQLTTQRDGPTLVTIIADRADTLDLLKNDSRELQKALQDAGLNTDSGSMEFSLREQNKQQEAEEGKNGSRQAQGDDDDELDIETQLGLIRPDAGSVLNYRPVGLGGAGVDVKA